MPSEPSDKSRTVAFTLAALLGPFGAHRFYSGRTESAVLMACTLGGLGVWWLYDVIVVGFGQFQDERGRVISDWEPRPGERETLPEGVLDELQALRAEVAELAERMDFTERLLASRAPDEIRRIEPS
ncbi:MAG: NINE protein [Gemmatimonadales bacterium]